MQIIKFLYLFLFFISSFVYSMVQQQVSPENFIPKLREEFANYINEDGYLKTPSPTLAYIFREGSEVLVEVLLKYLKCSKAEDLTYFFNVSIEVIKKEIEYCSKGYLVFYHGQQLQHRILQDLKEIFYEIKDNKKLKDFVFIRQLDSEYGEQINNYDNINIYLKEFFAKHGASDNINEIRDTLLPANFCFFGNSIQPGESSFAYFVQSRSIRQVNIMKQIAELFIKENRLAQFCIIRSKLKFLFHLFEVTVKSGNLLQIFIPAKLYKLIYFSEIYGVHKCACICDNKNNDCQSCILNKLRARYVKWPVGVDQYSLYDIDKEQVRILLQPKYFMNPDSGIKIFRYANESEGIKLCSSEIQKLKEKISNQDFDIRSINLDDIVKSYILIPETIENTNKTLTFIRNLIDKGLNINTVTQEKVTLLHFAAALNSLKSVELGEFLINKGLNVNSINKNGDSPLMFSCQHGNLEFSRLLINNGAKVNMKNIKGWIKGWTALHYAVLQNDIDLVKLLIQAGAKINVLDENKSNVLELAKKRKLNKVIGFLEEALKKELEEEKLKKQKERSITEKMLKCIKSKL